MAKHVATNVTSITVGSRRKVKRVCDCEVSFYSIFATVAPESKSVALKCVSVVQILRCGNASL
jgi:hypothetical protein